MERLACVAAIALASVASPAVAKDLLRCSFDPVQSTGQPARTIEIRKEPWDDALDVLDQFPDGEPIALWVEDGVRPTPVGIPGFNFATGGLTIQHWGIDHVTNLLSYDRSMQAVLSTHDAASDPGRIIVSTAFGTCEFPDAD